MESKDLRKGNLILEHGHVVKIVEGIRKDYVFCKTLGPYCQQDKIELKYCSPIPLNFNWLISLEFVSAKKREWYDLIIKDKKLALSINENSGKVAVNLNNTWHTLPFKKILFVHKLQNFVYEYASHELLINHF